MSTPIDYFKTLSDEILGILSESPNVSRIDLSIICIGKNVKISRSEFAFPHSTSSGFNYNSALIDATEYTVPEKVQSMITSTNPRTLLWDISEAYDQSSITSYISPSEKQFWITVSFQAQPN